MRRPEPLACLLTGLCITLGIEAATAATASDGEIAGMRYSAPIVIEAPAPFVRIALPPEVYAHAAHPDLRDLRLVDAKDERVPFALVAPRAELRASEQSREVALYALPARPAADGAWRSPIEVVVDGERVSVRRRGGTMATPAQANGSGGWLIDLGEPAAGEPVPERLRLRWSSADDFSVGYQLETSADLQQWRPAGAGQLMALPSNGTPLVQPLVMLPAASARFVRLVWFDPGAAPALTGAAALSTARVQVALDAPLALTRSAAAAPSTPRAPEGLDADARRGLEFDLGAALPIVDIALRFRSGTRIAPVRLQSRLATDAPWSELGGGVFYRLERGAETADAPALAIASTARYLRAIPDARSAALDRDDTQLVVHAALSALVFAQQGTPPFRLQAGSRDAPAGALPLATLVPQLDLERARFGRATVGGFTPIDAALRAADRAEQRARWRPWLLWGVLLIGIVVLGAMVWRLAVTKPALG